MHPLTSERPAPRPLRAPWQPLMLAAVALASPACLDAESTQQAPLTAGAPATATGLAPTELAPTDAAVDIADQLAAIPGLSVTEIDVDIPGYRYFSLAFVQPVDRQDPDGPTFTQQMALLHTDPAAPMIFKPQGYQLSAYLDEPTVLLGGNQLAVEHRFFGDSRPEPADWSKLTIQQAAADHHRIVRAIRPLYQGAWVSSGVSKDGMTAMYHRRFYPDDVDATIAYVAPLSYGRGDLRYVWYLKALGTPACREAIQTYQRAALTRRAELVPAMEAMAAQYGTGFDKVTGGADGALDIAVGELWFQLWQYGDASACDALPAADADLATFLAPLEQTAFFATDLGIDYFLPYYYQAVQQLGYPRLPTAHLSDLLTIDPNDYRAYLGDLTPETFDWNAMPDVAWWSALAGERILYVYGSIDPWTAGAFPYWPWNHNDVHSYVVPGGNHGAQILDLPAAQRDEALGILAGWTGVTPQPPSMLRAAPRLAPADEALPPLRFRR